MKFQPNFLANAYILNKKQAHFKTLQLLQMKKQIIVIAAAIIVLFSSCALHTGYMANSAALSAANFSYVQRHINGHSTATYILGIGGLNKHTLVDDAKEQMLSNNPLEDNQTLANLTVNFKTSNYIGVVKKVECVVTADVVEFDQKEERRR